MKLFAHFLIIITFLLVNGCVQNRYVWNNYDQKLYNHYKNPADNDQFIEELQQTVAAGEVAGRVPPGIYAEYGYALYEKGRYAEAIELFKKEQVKWPESSILMTKMISNAQDLLSKSESDKSNLTLTSNKINEGTQ
ncbi:hypothetical protein JCM30471_29670 [Desulfuromonas carbonis]